jgi:hypothetical protein
MTFDDFDGLFKEFLNGPVPLDRLIEIRRKVRLEDVECLMRKISELGDPSDYTKNDLDSETVEGFFNFVDFVSVVLIGLGQDSQVEVQRYGKLPGKFIPWVVKYVTDPRFHADLFKKYPLENHESSVLMDRRES